MSANQSLALALAAAAALAAVGVAAAQPPAPPSAKAVSSQDCFYHRDTDSFTAVDQQTINLRVGANRYYQLKLFAPCQNIDFAMGIRMRSRGSSWICVGPNPDLEIFTHSGGMSDRCPVTEVRRISPEELAAMPKKDRP